jgi:hypothetical protein
LYQNSLYLPSFDTLILKLVLILSGSLVVPEKEEKKWESQKRAVSETTTVINSRINPNTFVI